MASLLPRSQNAHFCSKFPAPVPGALRRQHFPAWRTRRLIMRKTWNRVTRFSSRKGVLRRHKKRGSTVRYRQIVWTRPYFPAGEEGFRGTASFQWRVV